MDRQIASPQSVDARAEAHEPSHLRVVSVSPVDAGGRRVARRFDAAATPECECPDFCLRDHENE